MVLGSACLCPRPAVDGMLLKGWWWCFDDDDGRHWMTGDGGRRASTSTWCPLGTLRETVWLSLSARRSSTTRLSTINDASKRRKTISEPQETPNIQPQYRKEFVPPFNVPPGWKVDLVPPLSCLTTVYGIGASDLRDRDTD
ncbi:predicted protein [Histoplasma capsulatum H143]|uniref:Uncharacterized protein n=1 Tax=Ajellomyces capsulatus (strain H143) TaxID=544712 RepID=C6HGL2_AJECH|nr:predicted protein [Histoplasma capsulatum H143]